MRFELVRAEVDAAAEAGVRNSQAEGIGRVVALDDLVCWNNLGRNVVFADRTLRARAIFGTTLFADDEPSQYDLDVHAVLEVRQLGLVLVLNHLGVLRGFRRADLLVDGEVGVVEPTFLAWFVGDVERTITVAGRLVCSRPRCEGGIGVLVSPPLDVLPSGRSIKAKRCAETFGEVTALAVVASSDGPLIALGGPGLLALTPLLEDQLGPARWEVGLGFRVTSIAWHDGALWAAGPEGAAAIDDYDWERLGGGGFAVLDPADGRVIASGPLPSDVAWGTGGVAVLPFGRRMAAVGRTGCLHLVDPFDGGSAQTTPALAEASLGIAHVAVLDHRVLYGFNRGGYRLHACTQVPVLGEDAAP